MRTKHRQLKMLACILALSILACNIPRADALPTPGEVIQTNQDQATTSDSKTAAAALGAEIYNLEGGYRFDALPGWSLDENAGTSTMLAPDGNYDSGPLITLIGIVDETDLSLDFFYEIMIEEFVRPGGNITAATPTEVVWNGISARSVEISGTSESAGVPIAGRITMAVGSPSQAIVILGFASSDRWESEIAPLFEAVQNSVAFIDAQPASGDDTSPKEQLVFEEVRQWAVSAVGSSEYSNPDWGALQAAGAPDTYPTCGDEVTAWAAADKYGVEWLELRYAQAVIPKEIHIYQTHSPGQIVNVEIFDAAGNYRSIYQGQPAVQDCPYILSIMLTDVDDPIVGLKIYLDQSVLEAAWNEIDAVELVGLAASGGAAVSSEAADSGAFTTEAAAFEPPPGLLWQAGGVSGFNRDQLGVPDGMFVDANGFLYVADRLHGVWFFDADGTFSDLLESDTFNNPTDVAVRAHGSGYIAVASWGNNTVSVFDFTNTLLASFGSEGTGPGQFGKFSPQDLAFDLNNNIYVLDDNEDATGEEFDRIEVFDVNGNFLYEWDIEEEFFAPTALKFWAGPSAGEDRIFVLGFLGGYLLEYDLQGNLIRKIGEAALGFSGPQDFDIDRDGNFYVVTWTPAGVMKLDHDGNLLGQWGVEVEDDTGGLPPGGFSSPNGIAVQPDGSVVYVSEWTGDYAYVTAFEFTEK